uniref:GPS domain-containing protein n=1 Tax=Panagrolaimus sp. ES5 TaxID=591445 RepID=A0AC34GPB7_9BILA
MDLTFAFILILITGIRGSRRIRHADNNDMYEIRIYDNAAPGTKATLNEAFDKVMRESKNCYAQLDTDVDWIEFNSDFNMFLTIAHVPSTVQLTQPATLHLMCSSHKMQSVNFSIHVTRRNRHPPKFSKSDFIFYVPSVLKPGFEVGKLHVVDHDPIIYNSQLGLSILGDQSHWISDKNGSIMVRKSMNDLKLYKPIKLQMLAIDYGSPQLFSIANITVIPVSVSQPQNVRVNIANTEYQIFEWDSPEYGIAEKYRITVKRQGVTIYEQEIDGQETTALSTTQFAIGSDYVFIVTAMDVEGETPSDDHRFIVIKDDIQCEGECSDGGRPMCFYGKFHKIEQYRDRSGLHCLCWDGFNGPQCDVIESCPGERSMEPFGNVNWPDTAVNNSAFIRCPYNADGIKLERKCYWDDKYGHVTWENVSASDVCKKQSSILVHLGVLANYAQKEAQTVSGIVAVQRFLDTILTFPSFEPNSTSIQSYDTKVAEHAAQVIDTIISRNLSAIPGNISNIRSQLDNYLHRFSKRIPVPFTLESSREGLHFKTFEWHAGLDTYPTTVGRRCYVHMPKSLKTDNIRIICMRNTTLYPIQEGDAPVMSIETDESTAMPPGTKALIGLKPLHQKVNYTCAYFDEKENGWSIAGITVLSRNFENGFVLCETTHLSLFTLLPESLFETQTDWWGIAGNIVPIVSTFLSILVTAALLLLIICPQNHNSDATMIAFLSTILLMHLVHIVLLVVPQFISLQQYDIQIYILLEYFILLLAILMAMMNINIKHRIRRINQDFQAEDYETTEKMPACKVLSAIILSTILCICSYCFNGILFYRVSTRKPQLQPVTVAFFATFVAPFVFFMLTAISYAIHSIFLGKNGIKKTPRWADDRENVMRELTSAAGTSLLVIIVLFTDAMLFVAKTTMLRNFVIAITQIGLCGALFIFTCYMCSVHLGSSDSSTSTGSEFAGNTLTKDRRKQDLSRDRLLDNTDKSASVSPGNATLHGFRPGSNAGYSTQNSVNSGFSSFKPPIDSIYIDEREHSGPLVSMV